MKFQEVEKTMSTLLSKTKTRRTERPKEKIKFWVVRRTWESNGTRRTYFTQENEKLRSVTYRKIIYCVQQRQNKKFVQIPLTPQPQAEDVLVLSRYYAKLKNGSGYEKRISSCTLKMFKHLLYMNSKVIAQS